MTMVNVKCKICDKEFEVPLRKYNISIKENCNFYCSKECYSHKSSVLCHCAFCGKPIWRCKSQLAKSKSGSVFCNRSHATSYNNKKHRSGKDNPNYVNGSTTYRKNTLQSQINECFVCGWKEDVRLLEVHHKDRDRENNNDNNLVILCPICHRKITLDYYELIGKELKEK